MVYNDYFLKFRPFIQNPQNYYETHYHEIIVSFIFYHSIYLFSPFLSNLIFGENYQKLTRKGKKNFDIHIVSMVQCLLSIAIIIPLYGDKQLVNDPIFGYTPYIGFVSSITIGYFIWDLYVCLKHFKLFGLGFLLHAAASLYVFTISLSPFCLSWVAGFLSFELSTPFVNINWFINKLPSNTIPFWFQALNGLLLIVIFFIVRIIWGIYAIYKVSLQMWVVWDLLPIWKPITIIFLNISLDILNVFWFSKMVQIATKKLSKSSTTKSTPTIKKKQ